MASTATVTGKTGAGNTLTAGVFSNVTDIDFQIPDNTLRLVSSAGISYISLSGSNTITLTASGGVYTLTVA
jgi:hypothetical protein